MNFRDRKKSRQIRSKESYDLTTSEGYIEINESTGSLLREYELTVPSYEGTELLLSELEEKFHKNSLQSLLDTARTQTINSIVAKLSQALALVKFCVYVPACVSSLEKMKVDSPEQIVIVSKEVSCTSRLVVMYSINFHAASGFSLCVGIERKEPPQLPKIPSGRLDTPHLPPVSGAIQFCK